LLSIRKTKEFSLAFKPACAITGVGEDATDAADAADATAFCKQLLHLPEEAFTCDKDSVAFV